MDEQARDAPVLMRIADGHCEELRHTQHFYFSSRLAHGYRIANHQLREYAVLYVRIGVAAEHRVRTQGPDASCPFVHQQSGGLGQGPARVDNVIDQYDVLVRYIPDDHHACYFVCPFPMFVADDHFGIEVAGDLPDTVGATDIRGRKG